MVYDFGLRLRDLRKMKNLSQTAVANRLELTRSTISAYERNTKTPSLETLIKLAILYNASIDYILGLNKRTNLYIDDLSDSQQSTIMDIVNRLKLEFSANKN